MNSVKLDWHSNKAVNGRIIHTSGNDSAIYEVMEYSSAENGIKAIRIYDQNKLLLDVSQYPKFSMFKNEEIYQLKFLTLEEEASVRMEMNKDCHIFKIQYQIDTSSGENECLPMSVEPSFVSLRDYRIDFDKLNCTIKGVENYQYGKIKFDAKQIDSNAGFIQNSVFEVWTNEVNDKVYNIIHCHINDMSDSVPIATEYLSEEESIQDFMEFDTDSAGQILRYKILIQDHRILTVLYNSGASIEEIPFKETKLFHEESLYQIKIGDLEDQISIARLNKIPNTMTCAHDKNDLDKMNFQTVENEPLTHCRMRYFERLPGYIDLEMVSTDNCMSLHDGEYKFSAPVCQCKELDDMQKTMIISMEEFQKEQSMKEVKEAIETLSKLIEENKFSKFTSLAKTKSVFQGIKKSEEKINMLLENGSIENKDLILEAKEVSVKSSKILRGMAAEMRMMALK